MNNEERHQRPSLVWPILLIGLGVIFLLSNLGVLPGEAWQLLWRLWPLALILIGVDLLVGRRSTLGSVVAALIALAALFGVVALLLLAPGLPAFEFGGLGELESRSLQTPLENVRAAEVVIDWNAGENTLSALTPDSPYLIDGSVEYYGQLTFDVGRASGNSSIELNAFQSGIVFPNPDIRPTTWDVRLHPEVVYDLVLDTGSGAYDFGLSEFSLDQLTVNTGSGSTVMQLPPGDYPVMIDGGSGSVEIFVPQNAGLRVELDAGSGSLQLPDSVELVSGEQGDNGVWESANFDQAENQIEFIIDQGSGSIALRQADNP